MFIKEKITYVDNIDLFNEYLAFCEEKRFRLYDTTISGIKAFKEVYGSLKWAYYLDVAITKVTLKFTKDIFKGNYQTYIFYLDKREGEIHIQGMQAFANLQRMSNKAIIDLSHYREYYSDNNICKLPAIAGIRYINPKYFGIRYSNCIGYDINSSYSWGMLQDIPDTSVKPRKYTKLKDGEMGFYTGSKAYDDKMYFYSTTKIGKYVEYAFPKIKSPFEKFVNYYYKKKMKSKTKEERQKNKDILNYSVGYIRRKNPFIHSAILTSVIERVESLIDDNTIYSNTDSIVSLNKRPDLILSDNLGDFKIEHEGDFVYCQSGYQWNRDIPSIRGKSKAWFKNGFDILTDKLPHIEANYYKYNELTNRIEVNINEKV